MTDTREHLWVAYVDRQDDPSNVVGAFVSEDKAKAALDDSRRKKSAWHYDESFGRWEVQGKVTGDTLCIEVVIVGA